MAIDKMIPITCQIHRYITDIHIQIRIQQGRQCVSYEAGVGVDIVYHLSRSNFRAYFKTQVGNIVVDNIGIISLVLEMKGDFPGIFIVHMICERSGKREGARGCFHGNSGQHPGFGVIIPEKAIQHTAYLIRTFKCVVVQETQIAETVDHHILWKPEDTEILVYSCAV